MKRFYGISLAILLLACGSAKAMTHVITAVFNNNSFFYSPSAPFTVNVGDVIDWQMNFSFHTLKVTLNGTTVVDHGASNGVPPGGSDYQYTVTQAGTYSFECTIHAATMNSSFTATASGVDAPPNINMIMAPIYPNPAMDMAMVDFTLDKPAHVTLRVFNSLGDLVQTPTNENMDAGDHMLMLDTKPFASGTYEYVLQAGDAVLQRNVIVVK